MEQSTLDEIYRLGKLLYDPVIVGRIAGIPREDVAVMMEDEESAFFMAYYRGYYETDITLRNSILNLAKAGSSPAQAMALKLYNSNLYING